MALNQMNEELNDAFETYFPRLGAVGRIGYAFSTAVILGALRLQRRIFGGRRKTNERVLEYPYVFRRLRPEGAVLDIGCVSSRLPVQLASLGYEVHGLDVQSYPFSHKNFHFHQADLFSWTPQKTFDIIILLSTIEHFGLGGYGDSVLEDADLQAAKRLTGWLKSGGQMIVTTPFGKPAFTPKHRIYDRPRLERLFPEEKFYWRNERYFELSGGDWHPSSAERLRDVSSPGQPPNGVVCLDLEKK